MQNFCLSEAIRERFEAVEAELGCSERIIQLDCKQIDTWEFRDRNDSELGDIDELALSIKHKGQCQPIIVAESSALFRPNENTEAQYIVIAGYRRWMACKKHDLAVQAVVRKFDFGQAIAVLVSENEKETVSDCSRGFFYHSLLISDKITQDQLSQRLNMSTSNLNQYLAFAQVPKVIWTAVGDLSSVSAKSAATIRSLVNKGDIYIKALIGIADKIGRGYGSKRIVQAVNTYLEKTLKHKPEVKTIKYKFHHNGKTLMTINQDKIKLDKSVVSHEHYQDLLLIFEKMVANFADRHFKS